MLLLSVKHWTSSIAYHFADKINQVVLVGSETTFYGCVRILLAQSLLDSSWKSKMLEIYNVGNNSCSHHNNTRGKLIVKDLGQMRDK